MFSFKGKLILLSGGGAVLFLDAAGVLVSVMRWSALGACLFGLLGLLFEIPAVRGLVARLLHKLERRIEDGR
ncbi:MAG: hypothetical protein ACLFWL_18240 [Candidatus Brocadiia bacterium]